MSLDSMSITHTVQAYMGDHMSRLLPVGRQLFQEPTTTQPESELYNCPWQYCEYYLPQK